MRIGSDCTNPYYHTCPRVRWDARVTHVVAPELRRTVKTLAAFAAGAWVLRTSFLDTSGRAHTLVEPVSSPCFDPMPALDNEIFRRFIPSNNEQTPLIGFLSHTRAHVGEGGFVCV